MCFLKIEHETWGLCIRESKMETNGSQVVRDRDSEAARGQIRSQVFVEVWWDYFGEVRLQCHDELYNKKWWLFSGEEMEGRLDNSSRQMFKKYLVSLKWKFSLHIRNNKQMSCINAKKSTFSNWLEWHRWWYKWSKDGHSLQSGKQEAELVGYRFRIWFYLLKLRHTFDIQGSCKIECSKRRYS